MNSKKFYIGDVLESLCEKVMSVSDNVFAGDRPESIQEQMDDFVAVDLPYRFRDMNVCQDSIAQFNLYARNRANGQPNVKRLQDMLDKLCGLFPIVTKRYSVTSPMLVMQGNDTLGFAKWYIHADIRVYTPEVYE